MVSKDLMHRLREAIEERVEAMRAMTWSHATGVNAGDYRLSLACEDLNAILVEVREQLGAVVTFQREIAALEARNADAQEVARRWHAEWKSQTLAQPVASWHADEDRMARWSHPRAYVAGERELKDRIAELESQVTTVIALTCAAGCVVAGENGEYTAVDNVRAVEAEKALLTAGPWMRHAAEPYVVRDLHGFRVAVSDDAEDAARIVRDHNRIAELESDLANMRRERNAASRTAHDGFWVWSDTDSNDLDGLCEETLVTMTAGKLRELLTEAREMAVAAVVEAVEVSRGEDWKDKYIAIGQKLVENAPRIIEQVTKAREMARAELAEPKVEQPLCSGGCGRAADLCCCDQEPGANATLADALESRRPVMCVRREVAAFALAMESRLRDNDHKPGWKNDYQEDLIDRIEDELLELRQAMGATAILSEAADVANFAMMAADVSGGLEGIEVPTPVVCETCDGCGYVFPAAPDGYSEKLSCQDCGKNGAGPGVRWVTP